MLKKVNKILALKKDIEDFEFFFNKPASNFA